VRDWILIRLTVKFQLNRRKLGLDPKRASQLGVENAKEQILQNIQTPSKFTPLSDAYVRWKQRNGYPANMFFQRSIMVPSTQVVPTSNGGYGVQIERDSKGTDIVEFILKGTSRMPARDFTKVSQLRIKRAFEKEITRQLTQRFR
jgi:hypothetical protein